MTAQRWISHAGQHPAEPQSAQVLALGAPLHPHPGPRPEASGLWRRISHVAHAVTALAAHVPIAVTVTECVAR